MDVLLVDQGYVLGRTVIPPEGVDIVLLNAHRLVDWAVIHAGDVLGQYAIPFAIRERQVIQRFELCPEIDQQVSPAADGKVLVRLTP